MSNSKKVGCHMKASTFRAALTMVGSLLIAAPTFAAMGRTQGSFAVTPTGAATYSIPIFTPPGPRGIQPSIALVYNSNAGVGTVGRGWALAGFSAISRCTKTAAQDTWGAATILQPSDAYCMDGNRLRLTSAGNYGQDGSTYQTELADFSLVTAANVAGITGIGKFTVQRKNGLIYTYGGTADSRVRASGTEIVHTWRVSEIRDRSGNRVVFTYELPDGSTTGTTHPTKIQWAATSLRGSTFLYSMDFGYGQAANAPTSSIYGYVHGTEVRDTDLLNTITITESGNVRRKYILWYGTSPTTGAKRLDSVKECSDAAEGDCLFPTLIAYQNGTIGANTSNVALGVTGDVTAVNLRRDFNGDGIRDAAYSLDTTWYVRFGSPTGYGGAVSTGVSTGLAGSSLIAGDLLGNGRDQILAQSGGTWYTYAWNGSSFVPTSTGLTTSSVPAGAVLADVDANGRADLVYTSGFDAFSNFVVTTRPNISTGSSVSFGSPVNSSVAPNLNANLSGGYYLQAPESAHVFTADSTPSASKVDVNGDGREDLYSAVTFEICLQHPMAPEPYCQSGGTSTRQFLVAQGSYQYVGTPTDLGHAYDINGDGCSDTILGSVVGISGCNGLIASTINLGAQDFTKGVADWDGDGRNDVLVLPSSSSTLKVAISTGSSLGALQETGIPASAAFCTVVSVDANGDGLDEVGCFNYRTGLILYSHNGASVTPDLATSFTDGYGVNFSPTYDEISESSYTPYTDAVWPQKDVKSGIRIVKNTVSSDGVGGTFTTTYTYYGGVEDVAGRGFLGFQKVQTVDSRATAPYRIDYYKKEFPNSGQLTKTELYQQGGTLIDQRIMALTSRLLDTTPNNQRYFVYAEGGSSSTREVGGSLNNVLITQSSESLTFDDLGNLTASSQTVTDMDPASPLSGYSWFTTTAATYHSPSTINWCLGLPQSISTTSSSNTGEASVTRSRSFSGPDYVNCRTAVENVEPGTNMEVNITYGFDGYGNVSSESVVGRNAVGAQMAARTSYTTFGSANGTAGGTGQFPVSSMNARNQTTTRAFHPTFGTLATETDPNGIVVASNTYDAFGRIQVASRADGTSTLHTYANCADHGCQNGDPSTGSGLDRMLVIAFERDSGGSPFRTSYRHFDQFDRPIVENAQLLSGGYNRVGRQYDALGRVYRETAPCNHSSCTIYWTTNAYDAVGRLSSQSRPASQSVPTPATTTFTYSGRTQVQTDPQGKVATKILDVNGWLRRSQDHNGYYQGFGYDGAGSLKLVNDSLGSTLFTASYVYGIEAFQTAATDMDLGARSYTYNSLGELLSWMDAKGQTFSQEYDELSRVKKRIEPEGDTTWTWDSGSHGIGRLAGVSSPGYTEVYSYDNKGRLVSQQTTTDQSYAINLAYNGLGQIDTLTYPMSTSSARVRLKYGYQYGQLSSVTDWTSGSAGAVYWSANAQNAQGQVTQETLGNGVVTTRLIDAVTGLVSSIRSGVGEGSDLQNHGYLYDLVGNVTLRQEGNSELAETFHYDNLYRLQYSQLNGTTNLSLTYDAMGNIQSRSDIASGATWTYHATKKHAVTQAGAAGYAYTYDANGNATSRFGQSISWSSYNYPTLINGPGKSLTFYYGPDRQRYKQIYASGSGTETTHYVGGILEKVVLPGGMVDWRHYVRAGGQVVAVVSRKSTGSNAVHYMLGDHQGSPANLLLADGSSYVKESFTAFGQRRDANSWTDTCQCDDLYKIKGVSRMGYTGHEAIGGVSMGLNHMNGRVQDAIIGRFLSADPYVPSPGMTQSYNRYAYVGNNPLTYIDPSGFCQRVPIVVSGPSPPPQWVENMQRAANREAVSAGAPLGLFVTASRLFDSEMLVNCGGNPAPTAPNNGGGGGGGEREKSQTNETPQSHEYRSRVFAKCNAPESFNGVKERSAPGAPMAQEGTTRRSLDPLLPTAFKGFVPPEFTSRNPIIQVVDSQNRTLLNDAREGHIFYPGTVLTTVSEANGGSIIETVGVGTGSYARLNEVVGKLYFGFRNTMLAMGCAAAYDQPLPY